MVRVDTPGRGKHHFAHAGSGGRAQHHAVEDQVGGALHLVQIDVAASAMIGREVKDQLSAHGHARAGCRIEQVHLVKLDRLARQVGRQIPEGATRQVVGDAHVCAQRDELVHQVRADEGGPTRDQYLRAAPAHGVPPLVLAAFCRTTSMLVTSKRLSRGWRNANTRRNGEGTGSSSVRSARSSSGERRNTSM